MLAPTSTSGDARRPGEAVTTGSPRDRNRPEAIAEVPFQVPVFLQAAVEEILDASLSGWSGEQVEEGLLARREVVGSRDSAKRRELPLSGRDRCSIEACDACG